MANRGCYPQGALRRNLRPFDLANSCLQERNQLQKIWDPALTFEALPVLSEAVFAEHKG